jgi:hypothetical protein
MTGAAALIHGYPARCGFGITRIKNQRVEEIPMRIKTNLEEICNDKTFCFSRLKMLKDKLFIGIYMFNVMIENFID